MKITKKALIKLIKEELQSILTEREGDTVEDVVAHLQGMPPFMRQGVLGDWHAMADGRGEEFAQYYPHIPPQELAAFAQAVLDALGE